jgi:hypothetical protein
VNETPHYGPIPGKSSNPVSHASASLGPLPFLCLRQLFLPLSVTKHVNVNHVVVAGVCHKEVIPARGVDCQPMV